MRFTDFEKSLTFADRAYKQAALQKDSTTMATANLARGIAHYLQSDFEEALGHYLQALDYFEQSADTPGMINTYAELIIFYRHEKKETQARKAIRRSLMLAAAVEDLNGLANLNNNAGLFYQSLNKYDSAAYHFRKGLNYYAQLHDKVGMSYSLDYLATALGKTGQFAAALDYAQQGRELRILTGDKLGVSESINNIGELLLQQNKPAQSLAWFRAARDTALRLNYKDLAAHTWEMESKALERTGHFQEAYLALKKYQELSEGLLNEKRVAAVEELQTKYETEKKEHQNLELQQANKTQELKISLRNLALLSMAVIVLLAAGIAYALYNRQRLRLLRRQQEARLEQERLRAEAIINTEEQERQRLARELHDGVGQVLAAARRSLQRAGPALSGGPQAPADNHPLALLDESIAEVRQLSHAMMPPSLRNRSLTEALDELANRSSRNSGISIQTEWNNAYALQISANESLMIYRVIQELLGNAIRHAAAKEINIEMVHHGDSLNIIVSDDGSGFDPAAITEGTGLKNIQSRIGFIGGEVIVDTHPGQGTTCIIDVPLKN